MRGLGLGFTNPVRTGGVFDVCMYFGCCGVGGVDGEWVGKSEHVVLCLCELGVWIFCADGRSRYLCIHICVLYIIGAIRFV